MPGFRPVLPRGRYFATTWTIAEEFGGLTNVLLHRTSMVATMSNRPIQLLTFSPDLDTAATRRRLVERGQLPSTVPLRNLWDEVRTIDDTALRVLGEGSDESVEVAVRTATWTGAPTSEIVSDGVLLQLDHFRPDGSRAASDERDTKEPGKRGGRRVTIYDRAGRPLASWRSMRDLQRSWLDRIIGSDTAFLINDSQFLAPLIAGYRRQNVTTAQVLHNSHLVQDATDALASISKGKLPLIESIPYFDLVTPLTGRQRSDLDAADLADENVRVIPNSRTLPEADISTERQRGSGVMLARLSHQKHPEHAVAAAALAHRTDERIHVDLFGDGPRRPETEAEVELLSAQEAVSLRGFDPRASSAFTTASFSLLSSRFEGQPLVLLESMAAGCLPIAYDVRYGPSDVITDGVDGFVVESQNPQALADAMVKVTSLDETTLHAMRKAAQKRSHDFSDEAVLEIWGRELRRAARRKQSGTRPTVKSLEIDGDASVVELTIQLTDLGPDLPEAFAVVFKPRRGFNYVRSRAHVVGRLPGEVRLRCSLPLARLADQPADTYDLSVDVLRPGDAIRLRLPRSKELTDLQLGDAKVYSTVKGNTSIEISTQVRPTQFANMA